MSHPPSSSGGAPHPWAPRGPGDTGSTQAWSPPGAPPATTTGSWGAATTTTPSPGGGAWAPPGQPPAARPWAPPQWDGGYPSGPPAGGGGGLPPHPPGYQSPNGAGGSSSPPAPRPAPAGSDRGGRLTSAVVGGIVGAIVAALVAAGLVIATDDTDTLRAVAPETTEGSTGGGSMGVNPDIQELLARVQPTVVQINTSSSAGQGAGSGFVYDAAEGLILTNAHVIEGADEISVTFFDGSAQGANLVGSFPDEDVAMIRVTDVEGLVAAELGSSDALRVGEDVVAIGNALGLGGQPTVTTGIVSALNRSISDGTSTLNNLIQTDAAINPGNSGGPLLNAAGQVVGINTAKIPDASNIGFALAIDAIKPLFEDLSEGEGEVTADTPFLGVSTLALAAGQVPQELLDQFGITEQAGLIISDVTAGSGADEAGLGAGDVIREVDGTATDDNETLGGIIRDKAIGDTIAVSFDRMGERQDATVTLGRR